MTPNTRRLFADAVRAGQKFDYLVSQHHDRTMEADEAIERRIEAAGAATAQAREVATLHEQLRSEGVEPPELAHGHMVAKLIASQELGKCERALPAAAPAGVN